MRELIEKNLSASIDPKVVRAVVRSYGVLVAKHRKRDLDGCLNEAGKFVEHVLRAVEFVRTGTAPAEIKSVTATVKEIEKDKALPETLSVLVPRIAQAMVYDVRSKRGAVHVKGIDPRAIDAQLSVQAASWIVAELVRLYHVDDEGEVGIAMATLMRTALPMVEVFGDETVVTADVRSEVEMLLLVAQSEPTGLDRRAIGLSSKFAPATVTTALKKLERERCLHKTRDGVFHVTGPGEAFLMDQLRPEAA